MSSETRTSHLRSHIQSLLSFYTPLIIDPTGGYHNQLLDDGTVYDHGTKHVVGTARFVVCYAYAARVFPEREREFIEVCEHGVKFLMGEHWDEEHGGFTWVLQKQGDGAGDGAGGGTAFVVEDGNKWGYSVAFSLLALSSASLSGVQNLEPSLSRVHDLLKTFQDGDTGAFIDSFDRPLKTPSTYRGQNSNMHMCEGLIASYEATGNREHLAAAARVAKLLTLTLAGGCGWVIEHYDEQWVADPDKNRDVDAASEEYVFRPPGYQPGHSMEWAKLLVLLDRHTASTGTGNATGEGADNAWMLETARALFKTAVEHGWAENGGLVYLVEKTGKGVTVRDGNKYYWALAEMIAAAGVLAVRGEGSEDGDSAYFWGWYDKAWAYATEHFIDSERGGWFPMVNKDNVRTDIYAKEGHVGAPVKCYPSKTDYHPLASCYEILRALELETSV